MGACVRLGRPLNLAHRCILLLAFSTAFAQLSKQGGGKQDGHPSSAAPLDARLLHGLYNEQHCCYCCTLFVKTGMTCSTALAVQIAQKNIFTAQKFALQLSSHPHCRSNELSFPPLASPCLLRRAPQAAVRVSESVRLPSWLAPTVCAPAGGRR